MKVKMLLLFLLISTSFGCKGFQKLTHGYSHPSDSELKKAFNERKDDFETLLSMYLEDSKEKIDYFWIGRENFTLKQLPKQRKQKYMELFNLLGVLSIGKVYDNPEIIFIRVTIDSKEIENGEIEVDTKGYYYSPSGVAKGKITFGATDLWGSGLKKINDTWFIYHQTRSGKPE